MSRTDNSIKNLAAGGVNEALIMCLKFLTRSVFIMTLGKKYLGISSLFANIITMLSLTELGFGDAIIFNLYKPIAEKDEKKINMLMSLYKKAYTIIGVVVFVIGLCIIPFLDIIIKDDISFFNAPLIFVLYLLQSVSTYLFFAYKRALIVANQMSYKLSILNLIFVIASNVAQIAVLYFFRNFGLYVAVLIIFNILQNIIVAKMANSMFPYIKEKAKEKIPKNEVRDIFKNCYSIFIYKINGVVLNATDNIILSTYIGLNIVGMYSNYLLIYTSIRAIIVIFYNSITASLGNLHATKDDEHEHFIFMTIIFITAFVFGIASVGFFVAGNRFILEWIGKEYLLSKGFVFLMAFELYEYGFLKVLATFRTTMGLFQQVKYRPIFGMIINLVVSFALVQRFSIYGVVIGTIAANTLTYMWYDPLIIYKHGFKRNAGVYFVTILKYTLVIFAAGAVSLFIDSKIPIAGWGGFIISGVICVTVVSIFMLSVFGRKKEAKYLYKIVLGMKSKLKY